jgi:hypothetical protein
MGAMESSNQRNSLFFSLYIDVRPKSFSAASRIAEATLAAAAGNILRFSYL